MHKMRAIGVSMHMGSFSTNDRDSLQVIGSVTQMLNKDLPLQP